MEGIQYNSMCTINRLYLTDTRHQVPGSLRVIDEPYLPVLRLGAAKDEAVYLIHLILFSEAPWPLYPRG